jgi:hypothetical protein
MHAVCAQTFSQYLATLGGSASKQTALHSTLAGNNIAGLYKQQTSADQFQVGSPSGSVYWTAGAALSPSCLCGNPCFHAFLDGGELTYLVPEQ